MRLFDVHQHVLPRSYLEGLAAAGIDSAREDGFPTPTWSDADLVRFADEMGIGYSVVSISSPHVVWERGEQGVELARHVNDELAAFCRAHPGRYGLATTLPLPDVAASLAEAERGFVELGAVGVKVPTNACGTYLGDSALDPLMAVLDERSAVVTIHPTKPSAVPAGQFAAEHAPLFEFLADTTRAVLNLVVHGTIERYPRVRWVVPHCGAFLPEVAHRMSGISRVLVPAGMMADADVLGNLRSLYYDVAGDAEPVMLDALLKVADPSHLLYGSDWPYTPAPLAKAKLGALLEGPHADLMRGVAWENTARLYGME